MPVKINPSGTRSIQVEAEVPGTVEQVWQAIATAPGISAWFVPAKFEDGADGKPARMILNFGPGMDSDATVTAWDPPRRFMAESSNMPGAPAMLTEWSVEARAGGSCVVRVVHSMATSSDAWDKELEAMESGWPGFFRILALTLKHFPGQQSYAIRSMAFAQGSEAGVWDALTKSLGITGVSVGQRITASASGSPGFAGIVERTSDWPNHALLIRLEEPAPGIAAFGAFNCGGPVMVSIMLNFFGAGSGVAFTRHDPQWQAWLAKLFPAPANATAQ